MKLKGINPIEQHVEKIVVGVLVAVFVGVLAMQFLTQPNRVNVGREKGLPPSEAFVPVEREARSLAAGLEAPEPQLPEAPGLSIASRFNDAFAGRMGPSSQATPLGAPPRIRGVEAVVVASSQYAPLAVPAPTGQVAAIYQGTISPVEVLRHPELASLVPSQQPFDKTSVSVEAVFNGVALKQALETDPDGAGQGVEPMPIGWWRDVATGNDMIEVLGVQLERETVRAPDGSAGDASSRTIVPVIPGRPDMLSRWTRDVRSLGDVAPLLSEAARESEEIQRPAFYDLIAGTPWSQPSEAAELGASADRARQVERLRRDLARVDGELANLRERLAQIPAPAAERPTPGGERQPPPPPRRGGPGAGGGGATGGDRERPRAEEPAGNRAVIERQLRAKESERTRVVTRLEALGERVEGIDASAENRDADRAAFLGVLENPELRTWAHDLTAEPGAVYRYRLRVALNNPFYGRNLQESQRSLAESSVVYSGWSEWTAPVEVPRSDYFFITSAEPRGEVSARPRATAELFVFYYGYYRSATVSLEPGDVLRGEARLPELKLANMDELRRVLAGDAPAATPGAPAPGGVQPAPGGGRGRPGAGPGPGASPSDGRDESPARTQPGTGQAPGASADGLPSWMSVDAPRSLPLSVDALFLDVARVAAASTSAVPGGERERFQAILRGLTGSVERRSPDLDRGSAIFRWVENSARAGQTQGAPTVRPVENPSPTAPLPRREAPRPPRRGEDGGGGGGG